MMEVVIEGFPSGQAVKNLPANAGEMGPIPGWGRFPWGDWGGGMASHSNIPVGEIPWTEETGGIQSMGSQSHNNLATKTTTATSDWNPTFPATLYLCLENSLISILISFKLLSNHQVLCVLCCGLTKDERQDILDWMWDGKRKQYAI